MSTATQLVQDIAHHPWLNVVGWTLVHFVWQAVIIVAVVAILLHLLRRRSAQARYATGVGGLVVLAALPLVTATYLTMVLSARGPMSDARHETSPLVVVPSIVQSSSLPEKADQVAGDAIDKSLLRSLESVGLQDGVLTDETEPANANWLPQQYVLAQRLTHWLPWLVLFWCLGVILLAIRLLIGLARVRRWRAAASSWPNPLIDAIVTRLVAKMKPGLIVQVLQSSQVAAPAVIGFFRPVILVPASMLVGLTPTELESILAHEIAHIRRHDWLINLLQSIVETVLFYHPAVWWISRQVRIEREHCCDDIAVAVCGNPLQYAKALTRIEELRGSSTQLVVAVAGGSLLQRIQRIVGKPVASRSTGWPAGAVSLLLVTSLAIGMSVTSADSFNSSSPIDPGQQRWSNFEKVSSSDPKRISDDEPIVTQKAEAIVRDSKTGQAARILPGIRLATGDGENQKTVEVGLKYSNLFSYTLIPARVAEQLQAVTLGEIDFGAQPPAPPQSQSPLQWQIIQATQATQAAQPPPMEPRLPAVPPPSQPRNVYVHEVTQPLEDGQRFVPYDQDSVWIPGHLGFYNMNQHQQHKFRVVRIDKVSLGIGPAFGPINALVLDDQNSDFGVLGDDWVRQVRGKQGEVLFFSAADSAFFLMAAPDRVAAAVPPPLSATSEAGLMTVESNSNRPMLKRLDQPGVRLLKSHVYDLSKRQSKIQISFQDRFYPVDLGVVASGVWVGMTLMQDLVAIDEKSGEVLWFVEWQKSHPFWSSVSIVEIVNQSGQPELVVETFVGDNGNGQPVYRYRELKTGIQISPLIATNAPRSSGDRIPLTIVESDRSTPRRAVISAQEKGRTAEALWRQWQSEPNFLLQRPNSVTVTETLVSANSARHIGTAVDAQQIDFNLPEGSGIRAEFTGDKVEVSESDTGTTVEVTRGRVELIDAGGVIRAWASPDGGAEVLVAKVSEQAGERTLKLTARRLVPKSGEEPEIVQCAVNPDTGAPDDETQSPHGAIRYDMPEKIGSPQFRLRMSWRYDVERIRQEAEGKQAEDKQAEQVDSSSGPQLEFHVGRLQHVRENWPFYALGEDGLVQPESVNQSISLWWNKHASGLELDPETVSIRIQIAREIPWEWPMRLVQSLVDCGYKNVVLDLDAELRSFFPAESLSRIDQTLWSKQQLSLEEFRQVATVSLNTEAQTVETPSGSNRNADRGEGDDDDGVEEEGWGKLAFESGLRSRLTLQTEQPQLGKPLWFKLEVKNFGKKPTTIDPQRYAPFRVLQAEFVGKPGRKPFIGLTPQTSGQTVELGPGESQVLWEKVDLNDFYLLADTEPVEVFAEGGEWAMQAMWQDSNRITIQLPPGELTAKQKLLVELLAVTPAEWKLSIGFGDIAFTHSPTNLKSDVTSIQLVFREAAAAAELEKNFSRQKMRVDRLDSTVFGESLTIAPDEAEQLWPDYQSALRQILDKFREPSAPARADHNAREPDAKTPWRATGRVTDVSGKPMVGAVVRAHCGMGSLHETGQAVTDEQGNYSLEFGPGLMSTNRQLVQAATISVRCDGYFEKDLGRQGDLIAAFEKPEEIAWGDRTEEHLFLPGQPKQVNFVMAEAVEFSGRILIGEPLSPAKRYRVSLTGKVLPPSSSVVAQTTTDEQGVFRFKDLPTGYAFQLQIRSSDRELKNNEYASPAMIFLPQKIPGYMSVQYQTDSGVLPYHFRQLQINVRGAGQNWRDALSSQESKPLLFSGDGIFDRDYYQSELVSLDLGAGE